MRFGLSDKPSNESAYTLRRHVELVTGLVEKLQLKGVTIVGQDWAGQSACAMPLTIKMTFSRW